MIENGRKNSRLKEGENERVEKKMREQRND